MDPFRYHDTHEATESDSENSRPPTSNTPLRQHMMVLVTRSHESGVVPCSRIPRTLPGFLGNIAEAKCATHHIIESKAHRTGPGHHIRENIVQDRLTSASRIIQNLRVNTFDYRGVNSKSAPSSSNLMLEDMRYHSFASASTNMSSTTSSPPDSLADYARSLSSSPPSSDHENGPWRRRTYSSSTHDSSSLRNEIKPCSFCKNNGETPQTYNSHQLYRIENGKRKVECYVLRRVRCDICGATGDDAHTRTHCRYSLNKVPVALMLKKTPRQGNGAIRKRYD